MRLIYDLEVFPNYFLAGFEDYDSNQKWLFEICPWKNELPELKKFLEEKHTLIGYNSLMYDNPMLNLALTGVSNDVLYKASSLIVGRNLSEEDEKRLKNFYRKYRRGNYDSIDLMRLLFSKALRVSLKELQVTMKWYKVQESSKRFDEDVTEEEVEEIKSYNLNDIGSSKALCKKVRESINLRFQIESAFGLECKSKDGVRTGVDLLANLYEKEVGDRRFNDLRTIRKEIHLGEIISDKVSFKSKAFNDLLIRLKKTTIRKTKGSLNYSVIYGGVRHNFGTGGIHSKDAPGVLMAREGEEYVDADVNSLYPSLLIEYGFCPAHLNRKAFLKVYRWLRDERIRNKSLSKMDAFAKLISETYKLSLNGAYGNLINKYSWLYDPQAAMGITLNGQLFLSMLSERLTDAGFRVDSLNTDGITCFVKKDRREEYDVICKEWEELTGLSLEFNTYHKVIRRDVNAYLAIYGGESPLLDKNGEKVVKEKGFFIREPVLGKGYDMPIVKIALYEHYINGVPVEETIRNHQDILDFCMMQKMGSSKKTKEEESEWLFEDEEEVPTSSMFKAVHNNKVLQKTNRFYAGKGKDAGYLYKTSDFKTFSHVLKESGVFIYNDHIDSPIKDKGINYEFYIRKCREIIRDISPEDQGEKQLNLFL